MSDLVVKWGVKLFKREYREEWDKWVEEGRRQGQKEMILQLLKNFSLEEVACLLDMKPSDISKIIDQIASAIIHWIFRQII